MLSSLFPSLFPAKADPCRGQGSCSLRLLPGGFIPLGKIRSVCLNKQPNPRDQKKQGSLLPSLFAPCARVFPGPGAVSVRDGRHMLSAGGAAVPAPLRAAPAGQSPRAASRSIRTKLFCASVHLGPACRAPQGCGTPRTVGVNKET